MCYQQNKIFLLVVCIVYMCMREIGMPHLLKGRLPQKKNKKKYRSEGKKSV